MDLGQIIETTSSTAIWLLTVSSKWQLIVRHMRAWTIHRLTDWQLVDERVVIIFTRPRKISMNWIERNCRGNRALENIITKTIALGTKEFMYVYTYNERKNSEEKIGYKEQLSSYKSGSCENLNSHALLNVFKQSKWIDYSGDRLIQKEKMWMN